MRHHIKSAMDTLYALDFRLDHEDRKLRTDRWIFTHPNAPGERLTLNFRMSEPAARTVLLKAKQIVGLATSDTVKVTKVPRVDARRKAENAAARNARLASAANAEARIARRKAEVAVAQASARRDELDRLLRGGCNTRGDTVIAGDSMLTVEQVADATGETDKVVRRAIESERLLAVMTRDGIRVPGHAVRTWRAA